MKKILTLTLAAVMLLTLFAGCGKTEAPANNSPVDPDLGAHWQSWQEGPTFSPAQAQAGVSVMESGVGVKDKQLNKPITNGCYSFQSRSIKALLDNLRGCLSMDEGDLR